MMRTFRQISRFSGSVPKRYFSSLGSSSSSDIAQTFHKLKASHSYAEQLIKKNSELSHMRSFKNLKAICTNSVPTNESLAYLHFLIERTSLYCAYDANCFYNLDGIGDFNKDSIEDIIELMNKIRLFYNDKTNGVTEKDHEHVKEMILDTSHLCKSVYQEFQNALTYKQTVLNLLNKEKEKHQFEHELLSRKLSKYTSEILSDISIHKLVSLCEAKTVEKYFPLHRFDLLHNADDAKLLQTVKTAIDELKCQHLLASYKKSSTNAELLKLVSDHIGKSVLSSSLKDPVHRALCEHSDIHNNEWNDYVLIVLARKGIYPKGFNFSVALRLKLEDACIKFLEDENQLADESYRNKVLVKCADYSMSELAKLIKKKYN
jgi:hypothetical protein